MSRSISNPNKQLFLREKYEKENRSLRLQEEFIALPGLKAVSGKFYAKHELLQSQEAPAEHVDLIKRSAFASPKDYYEYPPPSPNMDYGWFSEPLIPRPTDGRLTFPINQCDFIKVEILIKEHQKKVPEKKFAGVPFRC